MRLNRENEILNQALEALNATTGLAIQLIELQPADTQQQADAFITLMIENQKENFVVEIKNVDRFATAAQVKHQLAGFEQRPLLITNKLTDAAADNCKEMGLNFIDLVGNTYIHTPHFFIYIKGQKPDQEHNKKTKDLDGNKALTPTNLRMVFTLLCNPVMLNAPYREIAKTAGIALGTVGWGFNDLAARAHTIGDGKKNKRVFTNPEKLIQEWVTNYPIKLRPKLKHKRFKAKDRDWWKNLDVKKYEAQWGGEVAADKLTHYLKPNFYTLYLAGKNFKQNMNTLIVENRLIPDPDGDIEVLEAFWHFEPLQDVVPTLLIYADLVASNDPRNLETAKKVYEELIEHATD